MDSTLKRVTGVYTVHEQSMLDERGRELDRMRAEKEGEKGL